MHKTIKNYSDSGFLPPFSLNALMRSISVKFFFLNLIDLGVTSTSSSSSINSNDCSKDKITGGTNTIASSVPEALTFVNFFPSLILNHHRPLEKRGFSLNNNVVYT